MTQQQDLEALKQQVADSSHVLDHQGLVDFHGHVSARIPGTNSIIIKPVLKAHNQVKASDLDTMLKIPTPERLFAVTAALDSGYGVDRVHDLTKIDRWYLSKLQNISSMWGAMKTQTLDSVTMPMMRHIKQAGFEYAGAYWIQPRFWMTQTTRIVGKEQATARTSGIIGLLPTWISNSMPQVPLDEAC